LKPTLWEKLGDRGAAEDFVPKLWDSLDAIEDAAVAWRPVVMEAYMDALHGVFFTLAGLAAIGGVIGLLMRR
jgi:hypothetical protein